MTRRLRAAVAVLIGALLLTGCDFDVYKLPLPGGADTGDDPIEVTMVFRDVLDLVPRSQVKLSDVNVGQVREIDVNPKTRRAEVTVELRGDLDLPANTFAEIRQTSLLGEKFISLTRPREGTGQGELADGDEIPVERTGDNPEVEEVLSALSLLLNGGGITQVQTIAKELNIALEGREDASKSLLNQVDDLMGQLDTNKQDIVDAIDSLNRLSLEARRQMPSIDAALEELPSALDSLDRQREDLVRMLTALDRLSGVGVRVINKSKDVTIEALQNLRPVLTQLANSGDALITSINGTLTYPFIDESVGRDPQVARNLHMGDYVNLSIDLQLDLLGLLGNLPGLVPAAIRDTLTSCVNNPAGCPQEVIDTAIEQVCDLVSNLPLCPGAGNRAPGSPGSPGLPGAPNSGNRPGSNGSDGLGGLSDGLSGLLGRPGTANRVPTGQVTWNTD